MAYVIPDPAYIKARWPQFANVADATIQAHIDDAATMIDQTWTEAGYTIGIALLACHRMVLAGLGTGAEAQVNAEGLSGFSLIRSGQLTLQRAATSRDSEGVPSPWNSTGFGIEYYWLARRERPPIAAAPGMNAECPPLAAPYGYPGWPGGRA
jgi:hypothetical protein